MSWTDVFPVLTDEHVADYEAAATPEERAELETWLAVDRIINRSKAKHLVVFSLFWKNARSDEPDLPPLDRETLLQVQERGIVERFAPWEHYVQPLLDGARRMQQRRPDVAFRIYLAADLDFLIEDFTALGCEVVLMKSSSLRHNPGAMWRFLALEERRRLITVSDADRAPLVEADIQRTELMAKIGLGFWRVPVWGDLNDKGMMGYRPVLACQFGSNKPLPAGQLMQALIWHTRRGSISTRCKPPGCGEQVIYGTQWPDYGFDEWFLQAAVYPRVAQRGVLSFIPAAAKSKLLPLDIEYCTWANPRAESHYFGSDGKCCAGATAARTGPPAPTLVRKDCTVVLRRRDNSSREPALQFAGRVRKLSVAGDASATLGAAAKVKTTWLVDMPTDLTPAADGSELFLDRRLEECDAAVCSWMFLTVTPELTRWAAKQGIKSPRWAEGAALKIPRLDGPPVLWRASFADRLLAAWESAARPCQLGVFLAAWQEQNQARLAEASLKAQGWIFPRHFSSL